MPTVDQYAAWRGISTQRVRELIRQGEIPAERFGDRQWIIPDSAYGVRPRKVGRPMSPRIAWALIALLSGETPTDRLTAEEHSRLRNWRNRLVHDPDAPAQLASWLRMRGDRTQYRANQTDLEDLLRDRRVMPSGISDPRSGLSLGDAAEVWIRDIEHLDAVKADYLLLPGSSGNVVLHLGRPHPERVPLIGLVIADLADWNGPREDQAVRTLLSGLA